MTLPSTIACGNIIRPTLNFNWYAVPDSSRGNYHSVHNKSHNKHLENDFIIHCASIKLSCDPSEKNTRAHTHTHACSIIVMKWKLYYAYDRVLIWWWAVRGRMRSCLIGRCVIARQAAALDGGSSETPSSWSHYPNMFCFSNKWMAQESKYQKCIALHNGIPSEQGHVTMGHSRLPVLSLSICQWTWPPQLQQWGIQQHKHLAPRHRATTCAPAAFIFVVIFKDDILACRPLLLSLPWLFSTVV